VKLTLRREPDRNVTFIFFKGAFRNWFNTRMQLGDHFLVEELDPEEDGPSRRYCQFKSGAPSCRGTRAC